MEPEYNPQINQNPIAFLYRMKEREIKFRMDIG